MEQALLEVLKASPIAGAMIFLVLIFLKALDKRDERFDNIAKGVIETNTDALKENTSVISQCKFIQKSRD